MILFFLFVTSSLSNPLKEDFGDREVLKAFSDSFMTSKNDFIEPMSNSELFPLSKSKELNMKMNRTNAVVINDEMTAKNLSSKLEIWRGFSKISSLSEPVLKDVDDLISSMTKVPDSVRESFVNSTLGKEELAQLPLRCMHMISSSKIKINESEVELAEIVRKHPLSTALLYKVLILLRDSPSDEREEVLARLNVPAELEEDVGYAVGYRWSIKADDLPLKTLLKLPADSIINMKKESFEVLNMPIKLTDQDEYSRASPQKKVAWYSKFAEQRGWQKIIESDDEFQHHGHLVAGAPLDLLQSLRNESVSQTLLARLVNTTDFDPARAQILWEVLDSSHRASLLPYRANLLDISQIIRHFEDPQHKPSLYLEHFQHWFAEKELSAPWATVMLLGLSYKPDSDIAVWTTEDIKTFGKFIKTFSPADIDLLGSDPGSFTMDVLEAILSPSLTLPQLTSIYSKYKQQMSPSHQVMEPVHPMLFPALSSSELLSSQPPFLWSSDRERLLAMSSAFTPGQKIALQQVMAPGLWSATNISSSLLLQPRSLSHLLPPQLRSNLDSLLAGIHMAGYHRFYDVARNIQKMPRHLLMAWLEEALGRYLADGVLQEGSIDTTILLDRLTPDTEPDLSINNPDHTHPLAGVFDRWSSNKKTYLTSLLLTGLNCQQINLIRNGDFLEILAVFRYHMKNSGVTIMPSATRKCFAKKLRDYLSFKSVLYNVTVQSETELLSLLNTAEIQTVGGEILLTWGGPALSSIVNPEVAHEVLMEIALTHPSHFLTNGALCSCVKQMATSLLSLMIQHENGLMDFTVLAHLHNLLPFSDDRILEASAQDLKMYVRTVLSQEEKTLCLNREERDLMRSVILKAYGAPSQWNQLDLVELGDLLIVMKTSDLASVSPTSLRVAASQLAHLSGYSTILTEVRHSVSGSMYYEACMGWLGSEEGVLYHHQWKMYNEFIVIGNFLQFEVTREGFLNRIPNPRSEVRRKRQAEDSGVNYKAVYSRVMAVMTTKFNAKELTEEQKANATLAIISTQTMLGSYSFDVLGLEKANLTQDEILQTLQIYQEANNMTDHQSQQIAQLSVDTQIRMVQKLSPLLGLNASSLNLSEDEYSALMARPTFVLSDPTTAQPVTLQEIEDLMVQASTEYSTEVGVTEETEESKEVTTTGDNLRESKIINDGVVNSTSESSASEATEKSVSTEITTEKMETVTEVSTETIETTTAVSTENFTSVPDLGSVLSRPDILDLAIFTAYEAESEIFKRLPSLDDVELSCYVLIASGDSAAVIGEETIMKMESIGGDLTYCLETLGRLPWTSSTREPVWRGLKSKLFSGRDVRPFNREMMLQLNNLLPAVALSDPHLLDVTEENIDGLSIIGKFPLDDPTSLVQRYLTTNNVTSLTPVLAGSLGQLLCGLTPSQWQSLVPSSLFPFLVTDHLALLQCSLPPQAAAHLAHLLLELYGSPGTWDVSDVVSIGRLVSTLSSHHLSLIPPHAMEGLSPLALRFLSPAQWSSLSPDQLSFLSPHTASFISTDLLQSISSSPTKMREIRATAGEDSMLAKELEVMFNTGGRSVPILSKFLMIKVLFCVFQLY